MLRSLLWLVKYPPMTVVTISPVENPYTLGDYHGNILRESLLRIGASVLPVLVQLALSRV